MKDLIEEVKASMQSNRQRIMLTGFAIGWGMFILVTLLSAHRTHHRQNLHTLERHEYRPYGGNDP